MEKRNRWVRLLSSVLIMALMLIPIESLAQSLNSQSRLLEYGTQMAIRVDEDFKADSKADTGSINAVVESDVYSADGTTVLIKGGTPAYIEFTAESNGSWGKAGKVCLAHAYTKTIDNQRVSLRLSSCKKGGSKLAGVIALSVLFFPLGLISGCMKGSMPKIPQGTTFTASVMQNVNVN